MMNNGDEDNKQTSELLLRNLFYERETFDVFVNMLKYYEPSFATQEYLSYAVEAVHYTLHILKHFGTKNTLIMRDKVRKVRKTNTTSENNNDEAEVDTYKSNENGDNLNLSISSELDTSVNENSTTENTESKIEGETQTSKESITDTGEDVEGEVRDMIASEEARYNQKEMELNFNTLLGQFMNNNVIRCYFFLLKNFSKNSSGLNHMIIRFLERIISEMKLGAFLFHLPYLLIINKILADPVSYDAKYKKVVDFCKKMVASFFEAAAQNPMVYVLALFTHSKGKIDEITNPGEKSRQKEEKERAREERKTAALQKRIRNTVDRSANLSLANQLYDEPEPEDGAAEKNLEDRSAGSNGISSESEEPDADLDTLNSINKTILSNAKPKTVKKVRKSKADSSESEEDAATGSDSGEENEGRSEKDDSQSEDSDNENLQKEKVKRREERKLKKERRAAKKAAKLEKKRLRKLEKKKLRLESSTQERISEVESNAHEMEMENKSDAEDGVNSNSINADSMEVETNDTEALDFKNSEVKTKERRYSPFAK